LKKFNLSLSHCLFKKATVIAAFVLMVSVQVFAQYAITRIEPPFWWAGMKNNQLELMVYGPAIADLKPVITDKMIRITQVTTVANPNYLFILLEIDEAVTPGNFEIEFELDGKSMVSYNYQLLKREAGSSERIGFDNSDVIYLITPDRFANGDPQNDNVPGYADQANRADKSGRHGGDLKGIADHLDYIADMGFTAVWLNPVLENNMPRTSYHGYATTDYYKVDPRYGTNEDYRILGKLMKERGIKLIMDMIANHCGSAHWWMKDLPCNDWINYGGKFVGTNHRRSTVQDPHVSPSDKKLFTDGWFVKAMPDLNQKNPQMARYLIQNTIWWIEYAGLSGIRQDTYSYPDKDFMSRWSCEIMNEYPEFSIVGEESSENPAIVAYWQKGKINPDGYVSCLGSLLDFPLQSALVKGLNEGDSIYTDGLIKMYEMLANDFLYADPGNLVIFPDNHDMHRFFTQIEGDDDLFRIGIAYILTMRGIPQIYYGTEILMESPGPKDDGIIRGDFPGGWEKDSANVFKDAGLSDQQLEAKLYLKTLINWRKTKSCLHNGRLIHYTPENGTYVYFRYNEKEKVMVAINKNDHEVSLNGARFTEMTELSRQGRDVITGAIHNLDILYIPAKSVIILELEY
jgi:neopullulanase